jgi:hypothetical protein
VAPGETALEDAVAVAEAAFGRPEGDHLTGLAVERAHRGHGVGHLLTVGAHVLDRSCAHQPRDTAQALETRPAPLDGVPDEGVPRLARRRGDLDRVTGGTRGDPAQADLEDETVHPLVGDDQIGAAAQDAHRQGPALRPLDRRAGLGLVGGLDQIAGRAAHAHRAVGSEGDVLARGRHRESILSRRGEKPPHPAPSPEGRGRKS